MLAKKELVVETTNGITSTKYQTAVGQLQEELTKFGLSGNQSKVYIFLGKNGSKTAPEVSKSLKLPRTETYHILTSLQNKGIVSATFQHPIKFKALPLNKAVWTLVNTQKERVKMLENKEKDLTVLWENLPDFDTEQTDDEKFQMLKGLNQINSKISEMVNSTNNELLIFGSEKDLLRLHHSDFLTTIKEKNISHRILSSIDTTEIDDMDSLQIRKTSNKNSELCYLIKDDSEVLIFTKNASFSSHSSFAMWTNAHALILSNKLLFENLWKKSKA